MDGLDPLAAAFAFPKKTEDGAPSPTSQKKKKKKRKTLDFSALQAAGYEAPQDAATDIRAAREEAERMMQETKAQRVEEEAMKRVDEAEQREQEEGGPESPNKKARWQKGEKPGQWHFKAPGEKHDLPGGIVDKFEGRSKNPAFFKGNGMPSKKGRGKKGETPEQTWAREKKKINLGMAEVMIPVWVVCASSQ